jgi:Tfp pilus assembly protein FimV
MAWMIALMLLVAGAGAIALLREGVPSGSSTTISVRVSPSDTLWSIARANRLPGASTAATVEAIARANGLADGSLRPGTVLRVPAGQAPPAALAQADNGPASR